jgi:uncharacterized protein with NRDE domain
MCIVVVTTAHPDYALIILDNRDEFILRPTSRPHWWHSHHQSILSSRDLQREEQGTWLGITKTGNFAVLTNYRETDTNDAQHPIQGARSRGGMVTAWLTSPNDESTREFVHRLLDADGVAGVGGFSLLCGKLRRCRDVNHELEPLAIISNRCGSLDEVPWIAERRGEAYALSNTSFLDPETWPKVKMGKEKLLEAVREAVANEDGEEELVNKLYAVLDTDTLPAREGQDFEDYIYELRKSIFIPPIGSAALPEKAADQVAASNPEAIRMEGDKAPVNNNGMVGLYGTQRQTIILVDWEGNVTFRERSLWDEAGHPIPRGQGDMKFEFKIDGWNGESKGNEVCPLAEL